MIDAFVVETEPIDDRAVCRKTEHARFRIARLWTRRDRADFDKAEAEPRPCVDALAVLVEPGRQTDAIGDAQTKPFDRVGERHETGRASGRERVWHDVLYWVVRSSRKK